MRFQRVLQVVPPKPQRTALSPALHRGRRRDHEKLHDLLQPRTTRLVKLEGDYKFTCDCKLSTFADPEAQEKSDAAQAFLGTYFNTHPSYHKWSMDLCLPDTFVIESHLAVIPLIEKEGLDEIMRLVAVGDPEIAAELEGYPVGNFPKWGARRKFRESQAKQRRVVEEQDEDLFMDSLFGPSD
ncbi:hypothetical protein FA15DRAFT_703442 [Coprinopsis marcescibilis]|uniref:Uncharacterized protein n=1 Tax=Coprinopsis marcescibilis TaxID=230819 RepID=A0A5C3KZD6_COPMA|nr:hypothetical protein FA15DRAFT_703442 [Coprinopsis marcescibilis]